jgi:hypothetical protein
MIKTFTHDDVIRYIFDETTSEEKRGIERQFLFDAQLLDYYKEVRALVQDMDKVDDAPSDHSVQKILSYSQFAGIPSLS